MDSRRVAQARRVRWRTGSEGRRVRMEEGPELVEIRPVNS
jgi:hypothetical protein